jgi:succinyl-CoA synthetase beta subunit
VELLMQNVLKLVFRIILKDQNVKAILINILVELFVVTVWHKELLMLTKNMGDAIKCQSLFVYKVPMQLSQKELIDNSGMPILSAAEFQEAADQVQAALS